MPRAVLTKDFWSGLLFMGMGAAALILGSDLRVGTAARMGPGFVPHAIGWILIALGAAIALKGFARDAERVVRLHLRRFWRKAVIARPKDYIGLQLTWQSSKLLDFGRLTSCPQTLAS
jgi:hypothetical protein